MLSAVALFVVAQTAAPVWRDDFGVPHILAPSWGEAFFHAGYAVAEDRLFQMDLSRRLAQGKLAELLGPSYVASDEEVLRSAYTDAELDAQVEKLGSRSKEAFEQYAKGVNAFIASAKEKGALPEGYATVQAEPEPWTVRDSAAICVRLFQMFGRGGAGELRNLAALTYFETQPAKEKLWDVFDDFAWRNDPDAPTTVQPEDDLPQAKRPVFAKTDRNQTVAHYARLPKFNLLELIPVIRLAERTDSSLVAQNLGVVFRTGSYAIVVDGKRSATGTPLLLSGPQMGLSKPSIVHEMSISAPGVAVAGMDLPGVPGVLVGHTTKMAWGLTTGVADTEDFYCLKGSGQDQYEFGQAGRKFERVSRTIKVRGGEPRKVDRVKSHLGPVLFSPRQGQWHFARRSSFADRELESYELLLGLYGASTGQEMMRQAAKATMGFNLFYAATNGDTGYAYLGQVPVRNPAFDPRLPLPGDPEADWTSIIPFDKMPKVENPKSGLLTNWNNKPAAWWPNMDTPVWGRVDRVSLIRDALPASKIAVVDLERAVSSIARQSETASSFMPFIRPALDSTTLTGVEADAAAYLRSFNGWNVEGSPAAQIFAATVAEIPRVLFGPQLGTFISPDLLRMVAQPSLVRSALAKSTTFNYLGDRKPEDVVLEAFRLAIASMAEKQGSDPGLWRFSPGMIVSTEPKVAYSNRGSFIQIVELRAVPRARTVLPPGNAQNGPHSNDQTPLAAAWRYKPLGIRPYSAIP